MYNFGYCNRPKNMNCLMSSENKMLSFCITFVNICFKMYIYIYWCPEPN